MDVHNKKTRSYNMSRIRGKDTGPEEIVRKYMFSRGFRYRKNDSRLPGKPDVVLPKYGTVIFVNGCFWHHHNCRFFVWPKNNAEFWRKKIEANVERDQREFQLLRDMGWRIIIIWECELKPANRLERLERLTKEVIGAENDQKALALAKKE